MIDMTQLRLLVTGATGFIGSRLALHAHRAGCDVIAAGCENTRVEAERAAELRAAGIRVAIGKLQDTDYLRSVLVGRNTVVHLAAAQHESQKPDAYFHDVNVRGTRRLLETSRASGITRLVYGSSIGVYGSYAGTLLDETSTPRPENIYTRTKLEAERAIHEFASDFDTCVIRISETYGPSDFRLLKLFRAIDRRQFFMLGPGTNRRHCLHVNDLIRALLLAARHPSAANQTFIVGGTEAMTTNEMVRTIAAALERPTPRAHLPLWPFKIVAGVMESVLPPFGIQPPLHRRRLDFFSKSFEFSTAKIQSVLGFRAEIGFRAGALDTACWYRAHGHLTDRLERKITGTESV